MTRRARAIVSALVSFLLVASVAPWIDERLDPPSAVAQRPSDAQRERLAAERLDRGNEGAHAFLAKRDDKSPVRYDPCAPIHVRVNAAGAPMKTSQLVAEALDEVQDATGLVFVHDGLTDEYPLDDIRQNEDGSVPPVVIVWSTPKRYPDLKGDTEGLGGSQTSPDGDWYETGSVVLDAPQVTESLKQRGGRDAVRGLVMHELAHVVGLDHVDDPLELMNPYGRASVTTFGPGDLAGLAVLGSGGCRDY